MVLTNKDRKVVFFLPKQFTLSSIFLVRAGIFREVSEIISMFSREGDYLRFFPSAGLDRSLPNSQAPVPAPRERVALSDPGRTGPHSERQPRHAVRAYL